MDLEQHLLRLMAFSQAKHGHKARPKWLSVALYNTLLEIDGAPSQAKRGDLWAKVITLALDGMSRNTAFNDDNKRMISPVVVASAVCHELRRYQSRQEMDIPKPVAKTKQGKRRATRTAKTK